jgi:hypothetical protein
MKPIIVKSGLIAAVLVAGTAGVARAETLDVKVPFPFVVHGQTLPAGDYRVETEGPVVLLRGEHGNKTNVIFTIVPADGQDPAGDAPVLIFRRGETQYRLADIWESASRGGTVRN